MEETERPKQEKNYKLQLQGSVNVNKKIIGISGLHMNFGSKKVIIELNLKISGKDRIHIRGENGCGKSTLLKLITGQLKPAGGRIEYGFGITVGYFSQEIDGLDYNISAFDNLVSDGISLEAIYKQSRSLDLSVEDLKKKPPELSRGQLAKLAFTKLLLSNYSLLVLDEPTNHIDIPTRERLEEALRNYSGALLVSSHDRYFLEHIDINRILLLSNGRLALSME
jgi:ATPase subunit of ABC transporter with duplicated ATPase domains